MKKILALLMSAILAVNTFVILANNDVITTQAATSYADQLRNQGFPEAYIDKLVALHNQYPNWIFKPLKTGLDWSTAVSGERSRHSKQLINKNSSTSNEMYCNCASCYKNGNYVVQEVGGWVSASRYAVEYYMNPANWLTDKYIFQFESTEYDGTQTINGIETILNGTWMYNSKITYKDSKGATKTVDRTYAEAIQRAANYSGMSAYYLASKIRQEVGGAKPTAGGASGTNSTYPGIYNYYNIGAYTGANDGLRWASLDSSGYVTNCSCRLRQSPTTSSAELVTLPSGTSLTYKSTTEKQSDGYTWYNVSVTYAGKSYTGYIRSDLVNYKSSDYYGRPWTDPDKSIFYGARYIAANFSTQTSGYLQKFNVNPASSELYGHEYMANVAAASSEAYSTYIAYKNANILTSTKTFQIPVFNNMPDTGHDYQVTVLKYASTTEDGQIKKVCKDCGHTETQVVPKASKITRSWDSIVCVGTTQRPTVRVYDRTGKELTYRTDFNCVWSNFNSKDVGKYTVTVSLCGYYKEDRTYTYEITKNTAPVTFSQSKTTIMYTGTPQRPSISGVNSFGNPITYKTDFTVDYGDWNSTDVGKYTASATTVGNNYNSYSASFNYEIVPSTVAPICKLSRNVITMNGSVQRPLVTVENKYGVPLGYKKDFTVEYSNWNSKDVGRYTVTIHFISPNYNVSDQTFPYYINPKPTTFLTSAQGGFKAIKNGFTLKWNAQKTQTTGYQIQYATMSNFSNAATVWVDNPNTTTTTITGRASNKRYYVRIRPYTKIGNGTFYGDWDYTVTGSTKSIVTL